MDEDEKSIKIVGWVKWLDNNRERKKIHYKLQDDPRVFSLEVDAQKDYSEEELKKLIEEAMRNE